LLKKNGLAKFVLNYSKYTILDSAQHAENIIFPSSNNQRKVDAGKSEIRTNVPQKKKSTAGKVALIYIGLSLLILPILLGE
jgi:hypothetical protein